MSLLQSRSVVGVIERWVKHEQVFRKVLFSDLALSQVKQLEPSFLYYKTAEEMLEVLKQVLSVDVSKRSDRRLAEFRFDCLSVLFVAHGNSIQVEKIVLSSEYDKEKEASLESCLVCGNKQLDKQSLFTQNHRFRIGRPIRVPAHFLKLFHALLKFRQPVVFLGEW